MIFVTGFLMFIIGLAVLVVRKGDSGLTSADVLGVSFTFGGLGLMAASVLIVFWKLLP